MIRIGLVATMLALGMTVDAPRAEAGTDWSAASAAWNAQLREVRYALATIRHCDLKVERPVRRGLRQAEKGLEQALGIEERASRAAQGAARQAVARDQGGSPACAPDGTAVKSAQAAIESMKASLIASGIIAPTAQKQPGTAADATLVPAQPAPAGIAPVPDPVLALIRNCRASVVKTLGSQSSDNATFWQTYESCVASQGVGWF